MNDDNDLPTFHHDAPFIPQLTSYFGILSVLCIGVVLIFVSAMEQFQCIAP